MDISESITKQFSDSLKSLIEIEINKQETEAKVAVINRTDKRTECRKLIRLNKGLNKIPVSFTMKKPRYAYPYD